MNHHTSPCPCLCQLRQTSVSPPRLGHSASPSKPVLRYNTVLTFFQASWSLPWCVRDPQRADPKTTPVPSQDPLATLSSSPHTFGVIGMVGRSPSVLCPVHGLVVLQLLGRLGVVSEARDDFCGIILEGRPPLALHSTEGSMDKQADKTEGQRELHGARWREGTQWHRLQSSA